MPVPEPVPDVVMSTFGLSWPYATCHALTSGSSSVLPVSDTVEPLADDLAGADDDDDEEAFDPPELPQAASKVSGTIAAAVHTKRNLLATEEYSFGFYTLLRVLRDSHAGACDEVRAQRGPCPRAGGMPSSRTGGSLPSRSGP
jgi:hypothetical protein